MKKGRHEEIQKKEKVEEVKSRKKLIRRLVTTAIILGLVCLSGVIGVMKARNEEPIMLDNIQKEQDLLAVDGQITTLGGSYKLTIQYNYRPCNHEVVEVYEHQTELAGKTRQEVEKEYPDFQIEQFDEDQVVLEKSFSVYCEKHYILIWEDDQLAVYQTQSKTGDQAKVKQMDDSATRNMTANEKKQVKQGKIFSTLEEIETYLDKLNATQQPYSSPELYPKNN